VLYVAVQVDDFNLAECIEQPAAHAAERRVIEKAVIRHQRDDSSAGLLDAPLGEAEEFHVVVVQPVLLLAKRRAVDVKITRDFLTGGRLAAQQLVDPRMFARRNAAIGRIAENDDGVLRLSAPLAPLRGEGLGVRG